MEAKSKKTDKLLQALRKGWPWPDYAFISEFRGGTGWAREGRADAIAIDTWPSRGLELIGFELKTSRQDWLREVKQPEKCEQIKQFCDRWYVVVDDDYSVLRYHDEVPKDWGVMALNYMGKIDIKKEAPKLSPKPIDRVFLASLMRLASRDFQEISIDGRIYTAKGSPLPSQSQ